jgi:hypothetical protein
LAHAAVIVIERGEYRLNSHGVLVTRPAGQSP